MKQKKSISKKLHKAYYRGVTDVICGIGLASMFAIMFVIWICR